jgi:hypothetical protein
MIGKLLYESSLNSDMQIQAAQIFLRTRNGNIVVFGMKKHCDMNIQFYSSEFHGLVFDYG